MESALGNDSRTGPVFENSCGAKNSEVVDPVDFQKIRKNSVKFTKIQLNRV
jgi:hypothetical protein